MSLQIDRSISAKQNLINLINTGSNYNFSGDEFTIGLPSVYTSDIPNGSNTKITLTSKENSGFIGARTVKYKRLDLGETQANVPMTFTLSGYPDMYFLQRLVAEGQNLVLGQFYIEGSIPNPGDPDTHCNVVAWLDSILYQGILYNITLRNP